ncbi:MAG TPA: Uma2 family endonuclease [Bryobacteraceae bacterium]|nr:Uma2 family endonuclease [Bryobacteraceae bacterium]
MATTTLVTVHEFLQMPEQEGVRRELIAGEVVSEDITMGTAHWPHENTKKNVNKILVLWLAQHPMAEVFPETGFQVDEHDALIPELSIVFTGQFEQRTEGLPKGVPGVAIEVVSSEPAARLEYKVESYLAHGAKSVWTVFPEQGIIRIYDATGQSKRFELNQTLEDPALPGFSVPVAAIFEGV